MKIKPVKFSRMHFWPGEIADWGNGIGVAPRQWIVRLALPIMAVICLAPTLLSAADGEAPGAVPTRPSVGSLSSPPFSTNDVSANPGILVSNGIMEAVDDKQKLAVGDTVIFRVLEDQEDAKSLSVTDAGELDVPELGLVLAKGKTCKQLAIEIKSKLEQATYYHATVIIGLQLLNKTTSGRRVYVAGEVRQPGPQDIPAGETWTVSKAILAAGGFTDVADKKSVRLVRTGTKGEPAKTIRVNINDVWEKGRTEQDIPIEPEDLIYVPTRGINFQ
jgi:protein involved in polysaccharide export with SLBB domain